MLHKKNGMPDEGELLLCTVNSIQFHSVFVAIDEYNNMPGMVHISEIAPGRIRNIHDFVREGKKIVCKVLKVNKERGHVDLSLRRVNENQKRKKINEIKQEQVAEKILEFLAHKEGKELKLIYDEVWSKISKKYITLFSCFAEVVDGSTSLESLGVEKKLAEVIEELVRQRIKPPEAIIEGRFTIKTYESDGIAMIRDSLNKANDVSEDLELTYLGAGKYHVKVTASNFKDAESILDKANTLIINTITNHPNSTAEFSRIEKK